MEFGHNKTVAASQITGNNDNDVWLCYMIFDILYISGNSEISVNGSLSQLPLRERKDIMNKVIRNEEHRFEIVPTLQTIGPTCSNRREIIMNWLDKMIEANYEGLILKETESEYIPGEVGRKTKKWIKVKPDYVDGLGDGLDLVILGGYNGEGSRRSGGVSHFLLGVVDNNYCININI